ncbi:MAG: hypothetical protein LKE54_01600 [Prevotella sp.]|jgi:hypothetical protein|nr:hypothetical protein [Prevotella sp.]MCH3993750.1 hypothetical protein [Prevotella sp.]
MRREDLINMVKPNEEQRGLQRDYIRILLLEHDIDTDGKAYSSAAKRKDILDCFQLLKKAFIPYSILYDNLKHFKTYGGNDKELMESIKKLKAKLELMKYLRNKMSGHLDDGVIDNALQWQPILFSNDVIKNDKSVLICYLGLFEASINSYIDKEEQRYFGHDIDLCYPQDWEEFITFINDTCSLSLSLLGKLKNKLLPRIELAKTEQDLIEKSIWAGETDFKLKKRNR